MYVDCSTTSVLINNNGCVIDRILPKLEINEIRTASAIRGI